jgi:ABC-2 type transport system ATP-binding protein
MNAAGRGQRTRRIGLWGALLGAALAACSGSSAPGGSADQAPAKVPVAKTREGTIYRQQITSPIGDRVVFQVFEPTRLEVGKTYPLVLQSHGYGGSRETAAPAGSFIARLRDAGYYVISIDERGFGESSGTVRVMDPDYEGQDLVAVLDWAEDLEGLRRHRDGRMVVGSYGGSYGGMYQLLLAGADPQHRLRVIAPDITPHDLVESLDPDGVVKSGWGLVLVTGGEAGGLVNIGALLGNDVGQFIGPGTVSALQTEVQRLLAGEPTRQDPAIYEILLSAVLSNAFSQSGQNFFKYHSVSYFCDGQAPGPQTFALATPDTFRVPPDPYPPLDALLTQGFRDTLFNFNQGYENYQCLAARGGDVRLFTHQSGHILPLSISSVPLPPGSDLETALDPFYTALNVPAFQDAGGSRSCGDVDLDDLQFAWFEEKLQGKPGAVAAVLGESQHNVCLSLAEGDAVEVAQVKRGGTSFPIAIDTPQFNGALGIAGAALGNGAREALLATLPLYTAPAGGAVLAGIPSLTLDVEGLSGAEQTSCPLPVVATGCDPILFLGVGRQRPGTNLWDLVDDQLTPIRGFGEHRLAMSGIAERLGEGDRLALLIYAFHLQYPVTWSRDLLVPAVKLNGTIELPLLAPEEILRTRTQSP